MDGSQKCGVPAAVDYLGVERVKFNHLRVTNELGVALHPGARGVDVSVGVGEHVEHAWSVRRSERTV